MWGFCLCLRVYRIADSRDPIPLMQAALELLRTNSVAELLWASPREVLNVYHEAIACRITLLLMIFRKNWI